MLVLRSAQNVSFWFFRFSLRASHAFFTEKRQTQFKPKYPTAPAKTEQIAHPTRKAGPMVLILSTTHCQLN